MHRTNGRPPQKMAKRQALAALRDRLTARLARERPGTRRADVLRQRVGDVEALLADLDTREDLR